MTVERTHFETRGAEIAQLAAKQASTLSRACKPLAIELATIYASENPEMATLGLRQFYLGVRGVYLAASETDRKSVSQGWNSVKTLLQYHLRDARLVAKFPNMRSGEGECTLLSKAEHEAEKAEKTAQRLVDDMEARSRHQEDAENAALAALQVLSPEQFAAQLANDIEAWGGDVNALLAALTEAVSDSPEAESAPTHVKAA